MTIKYHELGSRPRSRVKQRSNKWLYIGSGLAILVVILFYFYTQQKNSQSDFVGQDSVTGTITNRIEEHSGLSDDSNPAGPSPSGKSGGRSNDPSASVSSSSDNQTSIHSVIKSDSDTDMTESDHLSTINPDYLIQTLNDFYSHLDQQPYMKDFNLKEPSSVHFSNLLQKLINTPPVVNNETDDLYTLLKNTAHFFRVLGKDNILALKGILDREGSSFENILKTFYTLTAYPEAIAKEYSLTLPEDALYDYAGFFLNTMGGRLYLFRRDSTSRMAVSYYSILVIDNANDESYNQYGLDIRPPIDTLINEIENTGSRLLLKEEYLDTLYDLKEKYN